MSNLIEWRICPRCNTHCELRPISMNDRTGEKYGFMFVCPRCGYPDPNRFYSLKEVAHLLDSPGQPFLSTDDTTTNCTVRTDDDDDCTGKRYVRECNTLRSVVHPQGVE